MQVSLSKELFTPIIMIYDPTNFHNTKIFVNQYEVNRIDMVNLHHQACM